MEPSVPDTASLERRLQPIFSKSPTIAAVYLFGSVARGMQSAESDLDLGLLCDRDAPAADELHRFLGDLSARLEPVTAPRPVDLVVLNVHQGPVFCQEVLLQRRAG